MEHKIIKNGFIYIYLFSTNIFGQYNMVGDNRYTPIKIQIGNKVK